MAWSYDPTDLATDTISGRLNTVRLLLGDTDTLDQQVQNEEVLFAISQANDNVYYAASWLAKTVASQYARRVDTQIDGALSAKYSDISKRYQALADNLEYQGKKSGAAVGILAGGITKTQIEVSRMNDNRIDGSFRRDRFRNPPSYETPDYE